MEKAFDILNEKKLRVIINTDAKNEADDQFAIAHALLTPKLDVKTVMAAHFGKKKTKYSMEESYEEIRKVVSLMGLHGEINISKGACNALCDECTPQVSEGAKLIIEEAMSSSERPLYVIALGPLTDIASAYLMEPKIVDKLTVIWVGGGVYPEGGDEINLRNDVNAANVVFNSKLELWQIPLDVYSTMKVSLAELISKVKPCGKIGKYLVSQLMDYNNFCGYEKKPTNVESWSLGDSLAVGLLIDEHMYDYGLRPALSFDENMKYVLNQSNRPIRVYKRIDNRFVLEDMFSKLKLNYCD